MGGREIVDPAQNRYYRYTVRGNGSIHLFLITEIAPGYTQTMYGVSVGFLNDHFQPQSNIAIERSDFQFMAHNDAETISHFITHVYIIFRQTAVKCYFADSNEMIRDLVILSQVDSEESYLQEFM